MSAYEKSEKKRDRVLNALSRDLDASHLADRQRAMRALLRRPLLPSSGETAETYILVRRHATWLTEWLARFPQWSLVINPELARLRKIGSSPEDATRPANDEKTEQPFTRRRYALLCLALAALERADRQITLGRLAESLLGLAQSRAALTAAGWDFTLGTNDDRRDLVHVVRLLLRMQVLSRLDGDEEAFVRDGTTNALYSISRPILVTLMAARSPSFISETGWAERLKELAGGPQVETDEARNEAIRTRLFRRLLDDPVLYYDTLTEDEKFYFDRQRPFIVTKIEDATGFEAEMRLEGIAFADATGEATDLSLPEEGTEGHATLLVATHLAERVRSARAPDSSVAPSITIPRTEIEQLLARWAQEFQKYWRKATREPGAEVALAGIVLERLQRLGLVRLLGDAVEPRPALGRFALLPPKTAAPTAELPLVS